MPESSRSRGRWWFIGATFAGFTGLGVLNFLYRYLDDLARGHQGTLPSRLIEEFSGIYVAALLFPLVLRFARRVPLTGPRWQRHLPLHLLVMVTLSLTATSLMALSRSIIFPLLGLGRYDYGIMRIRFFMEMPKQVLGYGIAVLLIDLFDHFVRTREQQVTTAQLESRLAQAQLQNLRLQLQPHFLFNALNTISSVMYEDPRAADLMIARLSELLRLTLRDAPAQETTVEEELRLLALYISLLEARFEERLRIRVSISPQTAGALVPQLVLQPLVENAVRHGFERSGNGLIEVSCERRNGALVLAVRDHGPGLTIPAKDALQRGIGLSNTAARLSRLYGAHHRLEFCNAEEGGLRVTIEIPFRLAESAVLSAEPQG